MHRLGANLAPYSGALQPIIFFDAVRVHTTPRVFAACRAAGVWPIVVPAKTTWLLQPLDTDVFLPYKVQLRKAFQRARLGTVDGSLSISQFLGCVLEAVQVVLNGRGWAAAFDRNGFGCDQAALAASIARQLGVELPLNIPSSRPSADQIQLCFPRNATVPHVSLWRPYAVPPRTAASSSRDRDNAAEDPASLAAPPSPPLRAEPAAARAMGMLTRSRARALRDEGA